MSKGRDQLSDVFRSILKLVTEKRGGEEGAEPSVSGVTRGGRDRDKERRQWLPKIRNCFLHSQVPS